MFLATLVVLWLVVVLHLFLPVWLLVFPVIFFVLGILVLLTVRGERGREEARAFAEM